jgi:nucleotide-binding universal stress UspA family protein
MVSKSDREGHEDRPEESWPEGGEVRLERDPGGVDPGSEGDRPPPVILVPLFDGAAHAAALPVARVLARVQNIMLHILLIGDLDTPVNESIARLGIGPDDLHDAVIERATGPIVPATLQLAARWPGATIVLALSAAPEPAAGASPTERPMARVGPAPRHLQSEHPLGTTLEELITQAPGPLVLVPPRTGLEEWRLRRILVPHDGTPTTGYAVRPAMTLAARAGAELVILHVARPGASHPTEPGSMTTPRYIDQPQHEWPAWLREFRERLCAMKPVETVAARTLLATGEPGEEILRHTALLEIDLVVLGWRGSLEGTRAATMKEVIREAKAPILILRAVV